jgi:hypothetical protein
MTHRARRSHILSGLGAEVAFAVLPLLVVLMVLVYTTRPCEFLSSPEWSFGAAILFGQGLVKFVAGLARIGAAAPGPVALVVTLVVLLGLVPSLLVLTMTLNSAETKDHVESWLRISQVALFLLSAPTYLLLGTLGEEWETYRESKAQS